MAMNTYKVLIGGLIMVAFIVLLSPAIFYYDSPQIATQLNATGTNATHSFQSGVFNPVNNTAFGGSNHAASGFFAPITQFSGLAFVFDQIGSILGYMLNIPRIFVYLIALPLTILGFPLATIAGLLSILLGFMLFVVVITGISMWMKYSIRDG